MNKNGHELIRLTAKAIGVTPASFNGMDVGWYMPDKAATGYWNPLKDDADAFRVAAHLRISIEFDGDYLIVGDKQVELPVTGRVEVYKILRRLIVEAAAEIGRTIP